MLIYQIQDRREQTFYTPTAPVEGMLAAELLKAHKSRWPVGVLLAFDKPTTQHRDGFVRYTIKDQDFPITLLKRRAQVKSRLAERIPRIETRYEHTGINNDLGHARAPPTDPRNPPRHCLPPRATMPSIS